VSIAKTQAMGYDNYVGVCMPTIFRQDGFRIVIYPNDHMPSHVHVIKGAGEVRIDLGSEDEAPTLLSVSGDISNKDVAKALYLVKDYQAEFLDRWREIHG
jgi:hypothetical protein